MYDTLRQVLVNEATELSVGFNILSDAGKIGLLTTHENMVRKTANFLIEVMAKRQKLLRV